MIGKQGLILALAALLALVGCEEIERTGLKPPCGVEGVARVELGRAGDPNHGHAEFTTRGGQLYLTAYGFSHGGIGDRDVELTRVSIGSGVPRLNSQNLSGPPLNAKITTDVIETDFTAVELPPGDYWLTAGGANIEVVSCKKNGVSDARPAPLVMNPDPPQRTNLKPPCGEQGVSRADLGRPSFNTLRRYENPATYAEFTAKRGPLYLTATGFTQEGGPDLLNETGVLVGTDFPKRGIGLDSRITNAEHVVYQLVEDDFKEIEVEPGRYWLLTSKDANIAIVSCQEDGVTDPKPVSAAPSPSLDSEQQRRSAP